MEVFPKRAERVRRGGIIEYKVRAFLLRTDFGQCFEQNGKWLILLGT